MTAPNTTNNVTVRKLADVAEGMWNKSKNAFVNASGDTMTGRLTLENAPINQIVTGTGIAATSSSSGGTTTYYPAKWNFDLGIATPSAGDQLVIKIPVAGHDYGTFMSTDNGTTYYPVAQSTGSTRFTTRYPVNAYVFIVFEEYTGSENSGQVNNCYAVAGSTGRSAYKVGCWRVVNDYDSGNTYDRLNTANGRFRTGTTGCYPYSLVCLDNTDSYSTLVTSNPGTGVNKSVNTDGKFVFPASILYYAADNTTAAGTLVLSSYVTYLSYPSVDVRYSSNHTVTFTTHKPVYIECTLNGDGTWSPTSVTITQTLRTGYYYIYLGMAYSTEYQVSIAPAHPLYYYDGTNLVSAEIARGEITAGTNNGELNVAGTDITVYTHPTDAGNKHIPAGGSSGQFLGWDSAGTAKWVSNPNTDIKVKATAKTDDANYKILATASASPTSGAATEAVYDTDITLNPLNNTISANVSGTAASAGKLTTARTTYVTLGTASTSTTRDWSGTTTIPVSGTLGIGNGGTGATSAAGARTNLDVYSKSETESLLNGKVVVVTQLPATGESGVTYYVKDTSSSAVDKYDEYIWAKDAGASTESWIHVGEKSIDLSNYVNALSTSGSGPLVASLSKSGNTLTATMGTISIDDLSDWATDTDVTVSSVTYHTWWPVAPTSSNQVYGLSMYNGRLFRIYNNKGTYSAQAYDVNTTYTNKSLGQGYGTCATDASTAAKIVSMSDYALTTGGIVTVKFTNALCASATMNINGKGAKPIYIKGAAVTANNAATVSAGDTAYFMYDGTAYHLLGTDRAATNPIVNISRSGTTFTATRLDGTTFTFTQQDNNTTYTQAKLGQGYGTCTTAEATAAKSVTLTGYELEPNGVVAVKFTNGLCASATMSINGKTATPIYINGAAVTSTSCKEVLAGDLAFFIYDGSHYQFICTDRISKNGITGLSISGRTITYTRADGTTGTLTTQDTTYSFDGEYNASTNKVATVSTVTNAVNALDVDDITGFGAGKTLATLTETDGKIAATFQDISITKSQVSDFSHAHGNITNDGKVGTTADYAVVTTTGGAVTATSLATSSPSTSGNTLEFIDTVSQSSKGKISATKKKVTVDDTYSSTGTNPVSGKAIAAAIETLDVTEVGGDGKYIKKIKEDNGKITATVETMDTTPTDNSSNAVTSGGVKTELDNRIDRYDAVYNRANTAGGGWVKLADTRPYSSITQVDKPAIWDVMITRCTGETSSEQLCLNVRYDLTGLPSVFFKRFYTVDRTSTHKFAVVVSGVGGGNASEGKVELWAFLEKHWGSIAIREVAGSSSTVLYNMNKVQYNYYSYNQNGGTDKPVEDLENHIQVVDSTNIQMATDQDAAKKSDGVYYVVGYSYAAYSSSKTYTQTTSTGPFDDTNSCVYSSQPYYCTTTISTGEAWNSNHWAKIPTAVWTGTNSAITSLYAGLKIAIKVPSYGGSSATQININGLGAKTLLRNTGNYTTHLSTNSIVFLTYDGTYWKWADYNSDSWVTTIGAYCETGAGTAAKAASSANTVLTAGMAFLTRFTNTNTYSGKLTLNVNSQGAKDLWLNGAVSSSSNCTLDKGEYWTYYDGTKFYIWTDGTAQFKNVAAKSYKGLEYTDGENLAYQIFKAGSPNTAKSSDSKSITITPEYRDTHFSVKLTESVAATDIIAVSMDVEYTGSDDGNWYWPFNFIGQVAGGCPLVFRGSGHYAFSGTAGTAVSADEYAMFDDTNRVASRLPANSFTIRNIKIERGATPTGFRLCKKEQTPPSHTHGNISNMGTLTDTAAAAGGNDYVVIRDADNAKIQTSTIKGTDVADSVSKKHAHSTLTLSTTAQAYDGSHTLALPSTDPYTSARTPASHTHGNIANGGTLTDTAAAAAGNDYVVIRDADNAKIQTSTIKGTDVADAVSKKHSHSTLTLSTTAQAYDGSHTLALPSSDPYTSARTPASHTHGNIQNGGTLQTTDVAIANGDKLVVTDASDSNKVARTSVAFDGSTPTKALTQKGTFETFTKVESSSTNGKIKIDGTDTTVYTHPAHTAYTSKGSATKVPQITTDALGHVTSISEVTISGVTPASHTHGNISNTGTLTDTAAAAAGNDYVVIRDADNAKIQTSTIKGTDVADAVSKKHSHSTLTLSTTAQAYDGSHTLALPSTDPYTSARTPASHSHGSITNDGKIGSTANLSVVTGTSGAVTTADLTTAAPSASGNSLAFIDSVSQDSKGKITATKKNVTIDSTLSSTSTNPVQNKAVQEAMATHTHTLLSAEQWVNAQLPNNSEGNHFKRFYATVPAYMGAVKLYDVTEFYDGTIVNNSEQSTFVGDVSFIREGGYPLVLKCKVCMTQSYNSSGVSLYGDSTSCHPIVLKDSRNVLSSWISGSYIPTGDIGSTVNMTPTANSNTAHCVIDCASYSTLYVNLSSVTGAPVWTFIDSSNKVIAKTSLINTNATVDVPQGAAKIICAIKNAADNKQYSYVAAENATPRYYLALRTNISMGCYMVCEGRFLTRTTATSTISARPLITEDFAISNIGEQSTKLPAGYSVHVDTSYTDVAGTLGTARKLAVSLSNTSTDTTFNGSADVTNIKVTGTLGIANGGTGATTKKAAEYAINGNMAQATAAMADNFQFVFSRVGSDQNATNGVFIYRTASTIWDYMKDKIKADSHCLDSNDAIDIWNSI